MRAWVCHRLSQDRSGLVFEPNWPDPPPPGPDQAAVRIATTALNYPDLLMLSGGYQFKPDLPFVPGTEACGIVEAVGSGVDRALVGRRVVVGARGGCLAERIVVAAATLRPAPAEFTDAQAAAYTTGGLTAHVGLVVRGRLVAGEHVLVTAAAGGMGLAAIALAKAHGATVTAVTSTPAKLAVVRAAGADAVVAIDRATPDLSALRDSVDIVFDSVSGALFAPAVRTLRWGGRYLLIGFVGGFPPSFATNYALLKGIEIVGVRAGEHGRREPAAGQAALAAVDALAATGALRPYIGLAVPLADADRAFAALADGSVAGKLVIETAI